MTDSIKKLMPHPKDKRGGSHFPWDLGLLLGLGLIPLLIAILGALIFPSLLAAKNHGNAALAWMAVALGAVGVVLLFFARLPLYQARRFRQIGPGGLDARHKRLYQWAWGFLGLSIFLLSLLAMVVR